METNSIQRTAKVEAPLRRLLGCIIGSFVQNETEERFRSCYESWHSSAKACRLPTASTNVQTANGLSACGSLEGYYYRWYPFVISGNLTVAPRRGGARPPSVEIMHYRMVLWWRLTCASSGPRVSRGLPWNGCETFEEHVVRRRPERCHFERSVFLTTVALLASAHYHSTAGPFVRVNWDSGGRARWCHYAPARREPATQTRPPGASWVTLC